MHKMKKEKKNENINIGMVLTMLGLLLLSMTNIARGDIYEDLDKASNDYKYKLDLVQEQSQRLDMWYAANSGRGITEGQLTYLKSITDEFIKRQNNAMESGRQYKSYLKESINNPKTITPSAIAEIGRVDQNEDIMKSDDKAVLANYILVENQYKGQQDVKWAAERSRKMEEKVKEDVNRTIRELEEREKIEKSNNMKNVPGFDVFIGTMCILTIYGCLRWQK